MVSPDAAFVGVEGQPGLRPLCKGQVVALLLLLLTVEVEALGILDQAAVTFLERESEIVAAGKAPPDLFPVTEGHVVLEALLGVLSCVFLGRDVMVFFAWHGLLSRQQRFQVFRWFPRLYEDAVHELFAHGL